MDWGKSKNIAIVLLIILNIFLRFTITYNEKKNYTITQEQEQNIKSIMAQEEVSIYSEIPKTFYPKRQLEIRRKEIGREVIVKKFFGSSEEVKTIIEERGRRYYTLKNENEYVEINNDGLVKYVTYFDEPYYEDTLSKEISNDLANEYIKRIHKINSNYQAVLYYMKEDYYQYTYYNKYGNEILFNDYIKIYIYKDKIEAEMWAIDVVGYTGAKQKVLPVDEILFNFTKNISKIISSSIYIIDISIGYYSNNSSLSNESNVVDLYYKVSMRNTGDYFINAFTNEIYDANLVKMDFEF